MCGEPIRLVPAASDRAAADLAGRPPSYYTQLFTAHPSCTLREAAEETRELMRRIVSRAADSEVWYRYDGNDNLVEKSAAATRIELSAKGVT